MTPADTQPTENSSAAADGILLLDKPVGVSSFAALYPVKRAFGKSAGGKKGAKIGHAGTLDPAASGLLVIGVGGGTRLLEFLEALPKSYRFTLRLGIVTDTYDLEGEILERKDASSITREQVETLIPRFLGPISQVPPAYSAIKIAGKRACDRVRDGETVEMIARPVTVHRLEILSFEPGPDATAVMELDCSKGTYVRTLAYDLGRLLGCGAAASDIRRLAIGPFRVENAAAPDADLAAHLAPLETAVANLVPVEVKEAWIGPLLHGNTVPAGGYSPLPRAAAAARAAPEADGTMCAIFSPAGKLLAVGELEPTGQLRPRKVLAA